MSRASRVFEPRIPRYNLKPEGCRDLARECQSTISLCFCNTTQNSALRRHCSADHRRQNLYAKRVEGLQRALDVQRLVHNWVRPHWGLAQGTTPAMAMGLCDRPLSMYELLTQRGFFSILH